MPTSMRLMLLFVGPFLALEHDGGRDESCSITLLYSGDQVLADISSQILTRILKVRMEFIRWKSLDF